MTADRLTPHRINPEIDIIVIRWNNGVLEWNKKSSQTTPPFQ